MDEARGQGSLSRDVIMYFTIIGTVSSTETIAAGSGIREREFKIKRFLDGDLT